MKKNVLLIIPNLDFGGAQRDFCKLTEELSDEYQVYVSVFNTKSGIAYPYSGKLLDLSIPASNTLAGKLANFIMRVLKIRSIKKRLAIDVSISYMEGANYINVLSKNKGKTVISVRGSHIYDSTITGIMGQFRLRFLMPVLYKYCDQCVALNKGIKSELVQNFGLDASKVSVIYNHYDSQEIIKLSQQPINHFEEKIFIKKSVVASGRLAQEKGYQNLIKVFSKVVKKVPDVNLVFLGNGDLKKELTELAEKLELTVFDTETGPKEIDSNSNVFFLNYLDNPYKYLAHATTLVVTSTSEGGPNVISEAMICKLPVISVDCPYGPREKLAPNTTPRVIREMELADYGILMPTFEADKSYDVWVEGLVNILDNDSLQNHYKQVASNYIQNFSIHKMKILWNNVIEEVCAG